MIVAGIGVALLYVAARSGAEIGGTQIEYHSRFATISSPVVTDASIALLMGALFRLQQTLGAMSAGEPFSIEVTRHFRGFAFWLFLVALLGFFAPLVAGLTSGAGGPLRLALDLRQLLLMGITLFLFLVARLLERARLIEQEMREIV